MGSFYVESSAFLAILFREPGALVNVDFPATITSALTRVECLRTLDRRRLQGLLTDGQVVERREYVHGLFRAVRVVALDPPVLARASDPVAVPLRTLDALHLVTAVRWREENEEEVTFVTHDRGLAAAARAHGLEVVGA